MTTVFYDIETRTWHGDHPGGWDDIERFGLAVAVTWCECHGFRTYVSDALGLYIFLLDHDRVVGFSIIRFDNAIVAHDAGIPQDALDAKSFDMLVDLTERLGHRVKLEQLTEATLYKRKLATGDKAVAWWKAYAALKGYEPKEAQEYLDRVVDYCMDDVDLECELFQFGCTHGYVRYGSRGEVKTVYVDWKEQ